MEIRFHLDENVNGAVANGLKLRGIDATTSGEVGLIGSTDKQQLEFAGENDRVLVTHDDDLIKLAAAGAVHAGIAYCHRRRNSIGQNLMALSRLWRIRTPEEMRNRVEFL